MCTWPKYYHFLPVCNFGGKGGGGGVLFLVTTSSLQAYAKLHAFGSQ